MGTQIIDFYIGVDGVFYGRLQHQYAEAMVSPQAGGVILWADAKTLPDGRFIVIYIEWDSSESTILKAAYSQLFGEIIFEDNLEMSLTALNLEFKQVVFGNLDEMFEMILNINSLELASNLIQVEESFQMALSCLALNLLLAAYSFEEYIQLSPNATGAIMQMPSNYSESIELTLDTLKIELAS